MPGTHGRVETPASPPAAVRLWREANRAAGLTRSWIDVIPPSSVDAILVLRERGPLTGATVAEMTTGQQGNMTGRTLPRLARAGIVSSYPGESERPSARRPTVWELTSAGKELADALAPG